MRLRTIWAIAVVVAVIASAGVAATAPAKKTAKAPAKATASKKAPAKTTGSKKAPTKSKAGARVAAKPVAKPLPRMIELGRTTCVPCKMMAKVLEELRRDYKGKLKVDFIDVSDNQDAVEKYKVKLIPLQIFFDAKGKEIFRHEGYYPKDEIVKKFKQLGIDLRK